MQSTPFANEVVKLQDAVQGAVSLSFQRESDVPVRDVVSYYWGLRVLMNAWAFCGLSLVIQTESTGSSSPFPSARATLMVASVMQCAMGTGCSPGFDILTRGKAAGKIRRGMRAGRALQEALTESHLQWQAPLTSGRSLGDSTPPPKRRSIELDQTPPPPPAKFPRVQTVTMLKGGRKICKAFNDSRGCSNKSCPCAHVCDVKGCAPATTDSSIRRSSDRGMAPLCRRRSFLQLEGTACAAVP